MPTVIDSLLVEMGIDTSKFEKDNTHVQASFKKTKEGARQSFTEVEDSSKKSIETISKLKSEVVGLALAFLGTKAVSFVNDMERATATMGHFADLTGTNINELNAWGDTIGDVWGDAAKGADSAKASYNAFLNTYDQLVRHPGQTSGLLAQFHFQRKEEFLNPQEAMLHLSDQFDSQMAAARKTGNPLTIKGREVTFRNSVKEAFGLDDATITVIERGRAAIMGTVKGYEETDKVTDASKKSAEDYVTSLNHLDRSFHGFIRFALQASGIVDNLANAFDLMSGKMGEADSGTRKLAVGAWALAHPADAIWDLSHGGHMAKQILGLENADGTPTNGTIHLTGVAQPTVTKGQAASNEATVAAELKKHGLAAADVPYALSAIAAENSTFSASRQNPISAGRHHATGLGQLVSGDRYADFERIYKKSYGAASAGEQVEFMLHEMKKYGINSHGAALTRDMITKLYRPGAGTMGDLNRAASHLAGLRAGKGAGGGATHLAINVSVHGDVHNPHKVGKEIADATHRHLRLKGLGTHSNTGLA